MLTVFSYAKLWRRPGALTDINFYELRYSGRPAAFLRGFRAIYLGVFFNIMIMATVTLAAIKIVGVLLGLDPYMTVVLAALITMVYSTTAGLWGVVVTDFFQFALAMIGSFAAAYYAVSQPSVGGLSGLMSNPGRPAPACWRGAVDTSGGESSGNIAASFLAWFWAVFSFTRRCLRRLSALWPSRDRHFLRRSRRGCGFWPLANYIQSWLLDSLSLLYRPLSKNTTSGEKDEPSQGGYRDGLYRGRVSRPRERASQSALSRSGRRYFPRRGNEEGCRGDPR
jgi:Na+/proline symporter